jgi:hypothetical protein
VTGSDVNSMDVNSMDVNSVDVSSSDVNSADSDGEWISSSTAPTEGGRAEMRRRADGGVDLRNSDYPDIILHYTKNEFLAWLDGVSKREFDHLADEV